MVQRFSPIWQQCVLSDRRSTFVSGVLEAMAWRTIDQNASIELRGIPSLVQHAEAGAGPAGAGPTGDALIVEFDATLVTKKADERDAVGMNLWFAADDLRCCAQRIDCAGQLRRATRKPSGTAASRSQRAPPEQSTNSTQSRRAVDPSRHRRHHRVPQRPSSTHSDQHSRRPASPVKEPGSRPISDRSSHRSDRRRTGYRFRKGGCRRRRSSRPRNSLILHSNR